ncbi:MAG: rhodanese-like domain-containing protein [Tamlana sp.]|jgi:rhodanese-related sulfurtransferase
MKKLFILTVFISFISCNSQVEKKTSTIDLPTLKKDVIGKDVQLIDVRSPEEYNAGHIDDAININIANQENFNNKIQELDKNKPVYIYCHSGGRSHRASKIMEGLGFTKIYDFTGGWKAWSSQ